LHGLASSDAEKAASDAAVVADMVEKTLAWRLDPPAGSSFSLRDVSGADRFSEWEFDFSSAAAAATTEAIAAILREEWRDDPSKSSFLKATAGGKRPIPKGCLKGFVDLLFRYDGYYYVVDWKSNTIGGTPASFDSEGVTAEMAGAGYFFQYLLYAAVLHCFLKETMGTSYSWEKNFGGIRYYFLRGIAAGGAAPVFADRPAGRLLDRLSAALGLEGP
jgi:exodeoxyribonuclease V beta subunit